MQRLLLAVTVCVLATAAGDQCVCSTSLLKYYKELGCRAAQPAGACCPASFDCRAALSNRRADKCHLKGVEYAPGAKVSGQVVGNPCVPECTCGKYGPVASLTCVTSNCGHRTPPNCVLTYTQGVCCSTGVRCENETISAATKKAESCEFEGKTYIRGQQFYPAKDPCKQCFCQKGFDGTLNGPWCTEVNCGIELHYGQRIHDGCAPIFFGTKGCCPIGWRCPASTDKVVAATGRQSTTQVKCTFGRLTLNVGDSVSQSKSCQQCKCTIPPHVSCVQTGYC